MCGTEDVCEIHVVAAVAGALLRHELRGIRGGGNLDGEKEGNTKDQTLWVN
mgnify:CR=1 FL=1|jgi:hypothetical protein